MDDLISRQAAIDAVMGVPEGNWASVRYKWALKEVPSARSTGKWVVSSTGMTGWWSCNQCGGAGDCEDKYCKHCGAEMEANNERHKEAESIETQTS